MLVNKRIDKYFLCIHLYVCAHIVMKEREEEKKTPRRHISREF